jgi:hypothetical protein
MRLVTLAALAVAALLSLTLTPADAGGRRYGSCYSSSYYYPSYYPSYSYTPAYQAPAYTAPAAPAYSANWKTAAMDYAKQKDDQLAFFGALKALGVNGTAYDYGYGGAPVAQIAHTPVQSDTVYGYSYSQIQAAYGSTDMNTLYQQAARLTQGAQSSASEANANFSSLVQQAGDNQARLAEYFVKSEAAARLAKASAKAVEPQPVTVQQTTVQGTAGTTVTQGNGTIVQQAQPPVVAQVQDDTPVFLKSIITPSCGACHTGASAKGKLDLSNWNALTDVQYKEVLRRVTLPASDPKSMPRDLKDQNKPGASLATEQLAEIFKHAPRRQ